MPRYILTEEKTDQIGKDRIDKEKGLVKGVLLLGLTSKSRRRRYKPDAVKKAAPLYANKPVNIDHPESEKVAGRPRSFTERFGKVINPRFVEGEGLRGDIQYNPKHDKAPMFEWWAENSPDSVALSHNADGWGKMAKDGWVDIEEIEAVRSVDLVADGGTTQSLFEGALAERYAERTELRRMFEINDTAMELIRGAMYDDRNEKTVSQKKDAVLEVIEEWSDLLEDDPKPRKTTTTESRDMEIKDLTLDQLKKDRPDLVRVVLEESASAEELKKDRDRIRLLEQELDEKRISLALIERRELVQKKLDDAKVPAVARTEVFKKTLIEAKDEAEIDTHIKDRMALLEGTDHVRSTRNDGSSGGRGSLTVDDVVKAVR